MEKQWYESWFESALYDLMYSHRDEEEAKAFLSELLSRLNPDSSSRFLDIACGTGRHARYIADKGYQTTGIDLSPRRIATAGQHDIENLEFFVQDMRKPFRRRYYDYVLNLFTSFGYFERDSDDLRVLQSARSCLRDDGTFVIDYFNSEFIVNQLIPIETKTFGVWTVKIKKQIIDNRLVKQMQWVNGALERNYTEEVKLYNYDDFKVMMDQTGFKINSVYGDYDLSRYNPATSPRVILIATC